MRIVLISDAGPEATGLPQTTTPSAVGRMLEKAFHDLVGLQPAHQWMVMPLPASPRKWSLLSNNKKNEELTAVSPDLVVYTSITNLQSIKGIPAALIVSGKPGVNKAASLRKKLAGVKMFITWSDILKHSLIQSLDIPESRAITIPLFNEPAWLQDHERQQVREQFTNGKEYFLYAGPIARNKEWEKLLQAFSIFKKWQQSGFQMMLTGDIETGYEEDFMQQLSAYKYRQDVLLTGNAAQPDKDRLAAAAFAVLCRCADLEDRQHIIDAFRNGIPVITEKNDLAFELASDTALFVVWDDVPQLSQHMISLYKNEPLYDDLAQKGRTASLRFNRQQMLLELSNALLAAAQS
ncbi:MAG TPA: glycosyltransferase [Chitinophagaceae bacterium]|nr:glycosyltransferase [Chitinophagaceae bacterium]